MTIARALEAGRERSTRVRTMGRWIGQLANERVSCPGGAVIVAPRPLACAPARRERGDFVANRQRMPRVRCRRNSFLLEAASFCGARATVKHTSRSGRSVRGLVTAAPLKPLSSNWDMARGCDGLGGAVPLHIDDRTGGFAAALELGQTIAKSRWGTLLRRSLAERTTMVVRSAHCFCLYNCYSDCCSLYYSHSSC